MKPVEQSDLKDLLNKGSFLILDVTLWGTSYLYDTICRGPSHITTKTGNKTLPTELWLEIISYTNEHVDKHVYELVYPTGIRSVQMNGGDAEPALICNSLQFWGWTTSGKLEPGSHVVLYEDNLHSPWHVITEADWSDFEYIEQDIFQVFRSAEDPVFSIPLSSITTKIQFLFHDIKIEHVIQWFGLGFHFFCHNLRDLDDDSVYSDSFDEAYADEYHHLLAVCPLCLSFDYTDESINMCDSKHCKWKEYKEPEPE
ncbi:cuticle-degrading protease [Fusarium longipes]|uniref:Cuticle-degrading protease n=1 Tax=Fusarium longipes TaxID=694270 RepID=A0A395SAQ5_9HYPO|nr:cuticle-degrading protease [Fusarium longipes]